MAEKEIDLAEFDVDTRNEFSVHWGENLPNHTMTVQGRGRYVNVGHTSMPQFRTRQQLYRFVSWLLVEAENAMLPDEEGSHEFDEVLEAVRQA